ncbi:ABC transporter ATP-binding protein [Micromonospora sediminicola]|uniref:ABC transporter ATP-binding protein n=1 Tax=Micromonospora sediminicola TaxID=946078 RepID=UPI0033D4CC7B
MRPLLRVDNLTRRYDGINAVDGVGLQLYPGQRHALIGPNGAGKSTLLGMLAGTIRPSAGRILLRGRDITSSGPHQRARLGMARTFQTPAVMRSLSVVDNVVMARWRHIPASERWLRRRAVRHRALRHLDAFGLGPLASRSAGAISHGQRRLLEVAAAMSVRPAVLLLDEPAAGLSDEELLRLVEALRGLPATTAILVVEHNQHLVRAVSEAVTVLHHGRVAAEGPYDRIQADAVVRDIYLGTGQKGLGHVSEP